MKSITKRSNIINVSSLIILSISLFNAEKLEAISSLANKYQIIDYIQRIIMVLTLLFFIILQSNINRSYIRIAFVFYIPFLLKFVNDFFIFLINHQDYNILARGFSNLLYITILIGIATYLYALFGNDSINLYFLILLITYSYSLIGSVAQNGLEEFLTIFQSSNYRERWLEVHDVTYTFGLFLLFFLSFPYSSRKEKIIFSIIMILLGWKRIEPPALLIASLVLNILLKQNSKLWGKTRKLISWSILCASFLYLLIIFSRQLIALANKFQINFSGRLNLYSYLVRIENAKLSLSYFGKGTSQIGVLLRGTELFGIKGAHSYIFQSYIECGTIFFLFFHAYLLLFFPAFLNNRSEIASKFYLSSQIYLYIIYFVDNSFPQMKATAIVLLLIVIFLAFKYPNKKLI